MKLRIASRIAGKEAEGPGRRYAVWVQGCTLRCPGCCNPEMFAKVGAGELFDTLEIADEILATPNIEGLSVLGGEPFQQAEALAELCSVVRAQRLSVMVFSGYTLAELQSGTIDAAAALLAHVDLLVDGRFEASLVDERRRWIGSTNQQLHFLSDRYSPHDNRFNQPNSIEIRLVGGELTINGWPATANAAMLRTRS